MSPSKWWATYGKSLPNISAVACSVLAQAVAASVCERNWSVYGQVQAPPLHQHRCTHRTVNVTPSHRTVSACVHNRTDQVRQPLPAPSRNR
eukprot:5188883-Prymnesium_polylepis.1